MADRAAELAPVPAENDLTPEQGEPDEELVSADVLVEEISIDGMCGVY
jgi:mycofactocin precursor